MLFRSCQNLHFVAQQHLGVAPRQELRGGPFQLPHRQARRVLQVVQQAVELQPPTAGGVGRQDRQLTQVFRSVFGAEPDFALFAKRGEDVVISTKKAPVSAW